MVISSAARVGMLIGLLMFSSYCLYKAKSDYQSVCLSVSLFFMHGHIFSRCRLNLTRDILTPQGWSWAQVWLQAAL